MQDVFYGKPEYYVRDLNVMKAYREDMAFGLSRIFGDDIETTTRYIDSVLEPGGKFELKDPTVQFVGKDENEDRVLRTTTFSKYLAGIQKSEMIMSPTMTVYKNKYMEKSHASAYISEGIDNRARHKKEMFIAKEEGDLVRHVFMKNMQSVDKILNNGLSGAECNRHTILYCPTIHSTLTSICRSAASNANSNNERIISGNRHYWSADIVEANILATCRLQDLILLESVIQQYNLAYPTTDQVMEMVSRSSRYYWLDDKRMSDIRRLVDSLCPVEKAAVYYTSDLYHLRKANNDFVEKMLLQLSAIVTSTGDYNDLDLDAALNGCSEDMEVLIAYLCAPYIRGSKLKNVAKLGEEVVRIVVSTAWNVKSTIHEYSNLFRSLFMSRVVPHTIAHVPLMIREAGVLSDTDSAMYTVQDWILSFTDDVSDPVGINVGHAVSFITSTSIVHILANMSRNMGVADDDLYSYTMKSEFYYPVFVLTNRAKTYYASIRGQEGLIYEEDDKEVKGSVLKGSTVSKFVKDDADDMLDNILTTVSAGKNIDLKALVTRVADIEREAIKMIVAADPDIFKMLDIKEIDSYKQGPYQSNYVYYLIWKEVFAPKYGECEDPPYRSVRLSLNTRTKAKTVAWLKSLEDSDIAARMSKFLLESNKDMLGSFAIPVSMVAANGIPDELISAMDIRGILGNIMEAHYVLLESLGFNMMEGNNQRLASDYY